MDQDIPKSIRKRALNLSKLIEKKARCEIEKLLKKDKKKNTMLLCKGLKTFLADIDEFNEKPTAKNFESFLGAIIHINGLRANCLEIPIFYDDDFHYE